MTRVFMCECCAQVTVLFPSQLKDDGYGNLCCPFSGQYVERSTWNAERLNGLISARSAFPSVHNEDFGWCPCCGEDYHPLSFVTDSYGTVVCKECSDVALVSESEIEGTY